MGCEWPVKSRRAINWNRPEPRRKGIAGPQSDQQQQEALEGLNTAATRLNAEQIAILTAHAEFVALSPLDRSLLLAPVDDEPYTEEDRAAVAAARNDGRPSRPLDDVLKEFGG